MKHQMSNNAVRHNLSGASSCPLTETMASVISKHLIDNDYQVQSIAASKPTQNFIVSALQALNDGSSGHSGSSGEAEIAQSIQTHSTTGVTIAVKKYPSSSSL